MIGINNWANKIKEDQEMREPKLEREEQQNFNAEMDAATRECNANILPQMLGSSGITESTISPKIKELQDEQNKQSAVKIELKLDANFLDENDETFFDDENVSRTQHLSPCKKYYTMYAKKTKLRESKQIALGKKQSENNDIE